MTDQIPLSDWLREGWRPSAKPTDNVYFCSCSEDVLRQNHFFVSHDNAGNAFDTLPNILTRLLYKTRLMVLRDKLAFLRPALVHAWLIRRIIPGAPWFPIGSCLHQLWTRWQKPSASFFYFSLRALLVSPPPANVDNNHCTFLFATEAEPRLTLWLLAGWLSHCNSRSRVLVIPHSSKHGKRLDITEWFRMY